MTAVGRFGAGEGWKEFRAVSFDTVSAGRSVRERYPPCPSERIPLFGDPGLPLRVEDGAPGFVAASGKGGIRGSFPFDKLRVRMAS